jgi:hypothetical protein
MASGGNPASSSARWIASAAPPPSSGGAVAWNASAEAPAPASTANGATPRARACARVSSTATAAPSPMTKPSRSTSNGRDAIEGSGLRDSAPICANALTARPGDARLDPTGEHHVSRPGAQQVSCDMHRRGTRRARRVHRHVRSHEHPYGWRPCLHRCSTASWARTSGLTRAGPLSRYRGYSSCQVSAPPIPDPRMTRYAIRVTPPNTNGSSSPHSARR